MSEGVSITDLVGRRALLRVQGGRWMGHEGAISEYRILETSPSGNWVKLMNWNGLKFWRAVSEVALVEVLRDLKAERVEEGLTT